MLNKAGFPPYFLYPEHFYRLEVSTVVKDVLWPIIHSNLPSNWPTLQNGIVQYIDKNSNVLYTFDLSTRISFADYDRGIVYEACGLAESMVEAEIAKSKVIHKSNKTHSNPFYITCAWVIGDRLKSKNEDAAKMIASYVSLMMYTSIHFGFVKYGANKNIMDYTIAHLDNSYKLRQMKSLFAFLQDNAITWMETYTSRFISGDDKDLTYVVDALHTRIKGKLRKIFNAYYDNHKSGNYLNADSDSMAEGDFHQMDNNSYMIDRLTNKVYLKLINHQFDSRFIKYSITRSDTSYQKLKKIIDDIISDDTDNDVRKVLSAMVEYYVTHSQKNVEMVAKGEFVSYMNSAYGSNTEVDQMIYIKSTLDRWLAENMYKYGKALYGVTAKQQYKRSVYMFFIFMINYEAKTA